MNVRELIEILGVGDLDAEVYVAANVEGTRGRPLATVEDARRRGGPRVCHRSGGRPAGRSRGQ